MNVIRCSMLTGWDDCARRTGARQYMAMLEAHGHTPKTLLPSVGAAIGTAVHRGAAWFLLARLHGTPEPDLAACVGVALDALTTQLEPGAVWDPTSPNLMVAHKQVERMLRVYWPKMQTMHPLMVEDQIKATISEGWELSGHLDYFGIAGDLDDLKTGAVFRSHGGQLGGYALDLEARGHAAKKAGTDFIKRVVLSRPQPMPIYTAYDVEETKRTAWRSIHEIVLQMEEYDRTGNPHHIRANPQSMMCTPKYCCAWGTAFCTSHKQPEEPDV